VADERVGRIAAYKFFDARQEAEERSTFGVVSVNAAPPPGGDELLDQTGGTLLDQNNGPILEQ
jgi:hypothetical protein